MSAPPTTPSPTGRAPAAEAPERHRARSTTTARTATAARRVRGALTVLAAGALTIAASLAIGAKDLPLEAVWQALTSPDGSEAAAIVWDLRVPRTVLALLAGAAFGVSGGLIQALTRNPLADPGILGVNAGAGLAVTLGAGLLGIHGVSGYVWLAMVGAALVTVAVYLIGSAGRGPASPMTLVLAGVALGAVLGGIEGMLTLFNQSTFRQLRSWGLGSVSRTSLSDTLAVAPFLIVGLLLAVLLSGPLNSMALGEDLAASLGVNVMRTRLLGVLAVTLLAGGATALTGGLGFVGLMVPHVVRWMVGPDQRWILAFSALTAPPLVLAADVVGRVVARPGEIEVGILTALLGAPVLIILVRRRQASGL